MIRLGLTLLAGLALFAAGAATGWFAHPTQVSPQVAAQMRVGSIQQLLDEIDPGYVLLAGDSNVAMMGSSEPLCGRAVLNAGIGGATTSTFLALFSELAFAARPSAAILTIGTNNLYEADAADAPGARERFAGDVTEIVAKLRSLTDRVIVTAVPPIGRDLAGSFDVAEIGVYSQRLKALCDVLGCTYVDPFAELRDGSTGFGLPGVNRNGVHLARYRPVLRKLEATLCPQRAAASDLRPVPSPPPPSRAPAP